MAYSTVRTGEVQGNVAATQLPNIDCQSVKIKAQRANVGNVYIGGAGVTKVDGVTDATTGLELGPGEDTGWLPIDDLSKLYLICDNAGDDITYFAVA